MVHASEKTGEHKNETAISLALPPSSCADLPTAHSPCRFTPLPPNGGGPGEGLPAISWFAAAALGPQGRGQTTQADPPAAAATATAEASAPAASATYGCASWLTTRQAHIRALQRVCASRSVGEF